MGVAGCQKCFSDKVLSSKTSSIGVSARIFFTLVLRGNKFLQCSNAAKNLFRVCCCFASKMTPCDVADAL